MNKYFVFDVESIGLLGEGYAYGWVVVDKDGVELDSRLASCSPSKAFGDNAGRAWVAANAPSLAVTHHSPAALRATFVQEWDRWSGACYMVADCPWPVESRFLSDCVGLSGPCPLIDVASVLLAKGLNPIGTYERRANELPIHNPLCDARQSARLLLEALKNVT